MHLATTTAGVARIDGGKVELLDLPYPDLGALLAEDDVSVAATAPVRATTTLDEVTLRAPVPRPGKVVVIGMNYRSHLTEVTEALRLKEPLRAGDPLYYTIPGSAIVGPGAAIRRPAFAPDQVDYEGELAVIIGRAATDVAEPDALEHVAGYTVCNDVSARDVQTRAMGDRTLDIAVAKSFDTFKPLGPVLVTADEIGGELLDLGIRTRVNGELVQDDRTTDAVHPVAALIAYVSRRMTLEPGDVISTGSPSGVGMFRGGVWLQPGDQVEITVERIGTLANPVA
jgi:2-keto-4-pentenoate hydratase/2-oxohepta-3-ene-1,7-dioic acid hydratase in catechol pathway